MTAERILIVDDGPNIVQRTRLYLERDGFRTQPVGDGQSALAAVENTRPELVVLDEMLPGLDGLEVCRRQHASNNP